MRVANSSLLIVPGRELDNGHVEVVHGAHYAIRIGNHYHDRPMDAELSIDGKEVTAVRLAPGRLVDIDGPPNDGQRFTAYATDSAEGQMAGLANVAASDRGLVRVVFRVGVPPRPVVKWLEATEWASFSSNASEPVMRGGGQAACVLRAMGAQAAGTGLSGRTNQRFDTVEPLAEYDSSLETTITLRLVVVPAVRELKGRPPVQVVRANPTPPALV